MKIIKPTLSILKKITSTFSDFFGSDLVGIYVHGSVAMDCYNDMSSDIDFLIVVKKSLTLDEKQKLVKVTLELVKDTTEKLEFSVITSEQLENFTYPTPYEFHYSDSWKQNYIAHEIKLEETKSDPDLAAHFAITKKRGFVLTGDPIFQIFPDVPLDQYLDSITRDVKWSFDNVMKGPNDGTCKVPTYAVLNFCRVLAFIKNNLITSKREGGEWGMKILPSIYAPIIKEALNEYNKYGSSKNVDCKLLKEYAEYCMEIILIEK
ncbi:DNA polymerase subunit beta [Candidatus Roizmanbacteria bacterium CG11_big_fil_rev_8_21_14_0_20_36_8]|uniref:DNA polymerase subunit beta n=2 Tax=Candidatus Roizmaniibacteriota TaxID=1752723 RepID=A0A2M6IV41_9BACT|nr:MAG: DNA polymerase subunit beta [Candidatus Roizmanbacteria bacterium CG11_big_fil_rev_8_21_14_0_20_36_8]PIZ65338.1 MAG: DNA polymerase subunit beta [Candidatus Roizmanbacteria bacterium CG_4_10_14_0_2_um_filter_36_9]